MKAKTFFIRIFITILLIYIFSISFEKLVILNRAEKIDAKHLDLKVENTLNSTVALGTKNSTEVPFVKPEPPKPSKPIPLFNESNLTQRRLTLPRTMTTAIKYVRAGILIDVKKREILWQKSMNKAVPIASMTKIMTCLLLLDAVNDGALDLKDRYRVTARSTKEKPTKVYLDVREAPSLESLGEAMMIRSFNDVAYLVSEIVSDGEYDKFIKSMNERATLMGLSATHFYNSNGLPHGPRRVQNSATPLDIAMLSSVLIQYPQAIKWTSTRTSKFVTEYRKKHNSIYNLVSTNKLLGKVKGIKGLKTGYTDAAGSCISTYCDRDGREMILVLAGCKNGKSRDAIATKLIEWAYQQ